MRKLSDTDAASASRPASSGRRSGPWYWRTVGSLAAAWILLAKTALPAVVRAAYEGRSFGWLNGIITGQDVNPVEHYLAAANRVVWFPFVAFLACAGLVYGWRRWVRWSRAWTRLRGRESERAPLPLAASIVVVTGIGVGWVEFAVLRLRMAAWGYPGWYYSEYAVWMTPLAYAVAFLLGLLCLAPLLRFWPRLGAARTVFAIVLGVGAYSVARAHLGFLHPAASAVLAAGVAVQAARFRIPWLQIQRRVVWAGAAAVLIAVPGIAVGQWGTKMLREQRAVQGALSRATASPNVLFLFLDTVRARNLSLYGYQRPTSPNIEEIASEGVTFDRAIATSPWTLPSTASVVTGRYHYELSTNWETPLDRTFPTLAEIATQNGYRTAGFFANPYFGSRFFGLDRGFVHWEHAPLTPLTVLQDAWLTRSLAESVRKRLGAHGPLVRRSASDMNDAFLRWLKTERRGAPFFAVINYFDAHDPFHPPQPFRGRFSDPGDQYWYWAGPTRYDGETLRDLQSTYDDAIAYLDHELGALMEALRSRGVLDSTLIVIVGDHGEEFGGHGVVGHGSSLYTSVIRVPMILRYPPAAPQGLRVRTSVSIRDLAATAIDIAHLEARIPGSSLRGHWDSAAARTGTPIVLSEVFQVPHKLPGWYPVHEGSMRSIVRGRWHYIRDGNGEESLYDLDADPLEVEGVADGAPELARFRVLMDSIQRLPVAASLSAPRSPHPVH